MDPGPGDSPRDHITRLDAARREFDAQAMRFEQARARLEATLEAIQKDLSRPEILHDSAFARLLAISPAIVPIPGTGSPEHAEENVAATAIELSRDEIEAISKGGLSGRTDLKLAGAGCQRPVGQADGGLPPGSGAATCSTIRAARTLTLTLARWEARLVEQTATPGPDGGAGHVRSADRAGIGGQRRSGSRRPWSA